MIAVQVMQLFTRSNYFGLGVTIPKESLVSDMSYNSVLAPEKNVTLYWETFSEASEENGTAMLCSYFHKCTGWDIVVGILLRK